MPGLPFALRRPWLLARDLLVDRRAPDLAALARIDDPEHFLWAILPHAARTFSACIALLPADTARAAAVAYLYCRMLDTYEDLLPDRAVREQALMHFGRRFDQGGGPPAPAPLLPSGGGGDARDRAHLLLVERCALVDGVYGGLPPAVRTIIADLVRDMAAGMAWGSATFAAQGGVLADEPQLLRYCREVLGNPVLFVVRLALLRRTGRTELTPQERRCALRSGEFIQLANVTRDIEKDLARGVAYHASLAGDLGRALPRPSSRSAPAPVSAATVSAAPPDAALAPALERVRRARAGFLLLALQRAPDYADLVQLLDQGLTRASAVLMLLFTDRHYRDTARQVGLPAWGPHATGLSLIARTLPAACSRTWARRQVQRCVADMAAATASAHPAACTAEP